MARRTRTTITDSLGRKRSASRATWGKVRRLPSGRYQASYVGPDEQRYPAPTTFDAMIDARAWLDARRIEIQRGEWKSPTVLERERAEAAMIAKAETFALYAATWVAERVSSKGRPLAPKTRQEYTRQLATSLAAFRDDQLKAITPARVRTWHADRMTVAPTAAGAEARLLHAIMATAVHDGILERNPVPGGIRTTKTGMQHRIPTVDELGIVLATINPRYRLAVLLAAYGGLRLSEWRALRRQDVTIAGGRATINVTRQAVYVVGEGWHVTEPKSAEGIRTVTMPAALAVDVQRHLDEHTGAFPDSLLFVTRTGRFISDHQWNDAWNPARDAAGLRRVQLDKNGKPVTGKGGRPLHVTVVREHDLRAFAGTMLTQHGATLRQTMTFLGHSTTAAAMAYQHALRERDAELADLMPLPTANARPKMTALPDHKTKPASGWR